MSTPKGEEENGWSLPFPRSQLGEPATTHEDLKPVEYLLDDRGSIPVTLRPMNQRDGSVRWAVMDGDRMVMNKTGKFVYSRSPSRRDEKYLEQTRFDTSKQAIALYVVNHADASFPGS